MVHITTRRHIASETRKRILSEKDEGKKNRKHDGGSEGVVHAVEQSKEQSKEEKHKCRTQ
jgi:hypothetical protein